MKKTISISSSCYNEEGNLQEWYSRLVNVFKQIPQYDYEIIIADNCSTDGSRDIMRKIASADKRFKVIFNANNFGQIRSPFNALLQCSGDGAVQMVSDLQEPPEVILDMVRRWEEGYQVVVGVKDGTKEGLLMSAARKFYYALLAYVSDSNRIIQNFTGFGLYDRKFVEALRRYRDPYPYLRGLVSEIGFKRTEVHYMQAQRKYGVTKNNFFKLYDYAMNGFVNNTKLPLRLAVFVVFCLAGISFLISLLYLIYKIVFWDTFTIGMAPIIIGFFFFAAIQLIFIGIIGEYVGAILTQVKNSPLVIEDEKLNFD